MEKGSLKISRVLGLFENNVGSHYEIYMESLSGSGEFCIASGIIESVDYDENFNLLMITLEDNSLEKFSFDSIKAIDIMERHRHNEIRFTYNDNSFFKIFTSGKVVAE